jgi:hypothetical protein
MDGGNWLRKSPVVFFTLSICLLFCLPVFAQSESEQLIIINKSKNQLAFYLDGEIVKLFDVATGVKPSYTPEGTFKIVNKIKNRPYYKENIPGGDPRNPLGDRWLGLDAKGTYGTTYAIHGNSNASSIGKYISAGCVRMHNDDVHWLFDHLNLQTKVIITSSELSFDEIAEENNVILAYKTLDGDVYVDGEPYTFEQKTVLYKGRAMVPMRAIFEILGAEVTWQSATSTVLAQKGQKTITHKVNSKEALINDIQIQFDVKSLLRDGITLIPLRFVTEAFGAQVEWVDETQSIHIYTKY